jgi:hypothetical protein
VLDSTASFVRILWAVMNTEDLQTAKEALRVREDIAAASIGTHIGAWSAGNPGPSLVVNLPQWADSRGIDSVVWTALPCKFNSENGQAPTIDQVVEYLSGLTGRRREEAERYIRFAPKQIDTPCRRRIESALQWTPVEPHF